MSDLGSPHVLHCHATTWHDGSVALLARGPRIVALASERVGDRYKHSWNSRLAYEHLAGLGLYPECFGGAGDRFVDASAGLLLGDHHLYHAASTFFASGASDAAVLVVDGQGPRPPGTSCTTLWQGRDRGLRLLEDLCGTSGKFAASSIGHFYTAIGALCGMRDLYAEGRTMALAAYGKPAGILDWLRQYVWSEPDGRYHLDPRFNLAVLGNTFGPQFYGWRPQPPEVQAVWDDLVGVLPHLASHSAPSDDVAAEIAYAGQLLLEELLLGLARRARELTGSPTLCLAGGVALNCVANQRIVEGGSFEEVYVTYCPSDEGQALGKLLLELADSTPLDLAELVASAYLGPTYAVSDVRAALAAEEPWCTSTVLRTADLAAAVAERLASGEVVAMWQGASEFGPRALGHRSILADPRISEMRVRLNARVKDREWYRPVAPIVMEEHANDYFELETPSPFMTRAVLVRADKVDVIPAAVHVDGTARVQTISRQQDAVIHGFIEAFYRRTGVPVLLNTSFNRRNEPLVETPHDALAAFRAMDIDALVLEKALVLKRADESVLK